MNVSHSPGTNVCKDNGGCEQLCLYRGNGQHTCACAHGMLAEDNRSCRDYDGYLLYSERTILKSIHLSDETNLNAPIKPFEDPDHMKNVIALSFDYHGGGGKGANRIFFSDIHFGNIQQINDDGTDRKIVVDSKYGAINQKIHRALLTITHQCSPFCMCTYISAVLPSGYPFLLTSPLIIACCPSFPTAVNSHHRAL